MNESNNDSVVKQGLLVLALLAFIGAGFRVFGSQEDILKRLDEKTLLYISVSAILLRFREVTTFKFGDNEVEFEKRLAAVKTELKEDLDKSTQNIEKELNRSKVATEVAIDEAKYTCGRGSELPEQEHLLFEEIIESGNRKDDPWKGQFGGESQNKSLKLIASVTSAGDSCEYFYVKLRVQSTNQSNYQLAGKVKFYLHPTFKKSQVIVPVINGIAEINLRAWGAFTVGVITEDRIKLELDLAELKDPTLSRFVSR